MNNKDIQKSMVLAIAWCIIAPIAMKTLAQQPDAIFETVKTASNLVYVFAAHIIFA